MAFDYDTDITPIAMGRKAAFGPVPTAPYEKTQRTMAPQEVLYHLKKHKGLVLLHFYLGNAGIPGNSFLQTSAQFARDQILRLVESNSSGCGFYAFIGKNSVMHVTPLHVYADTSQAEGEQATLSAPNPSAPISAPLTKLQATQHGKPFQQYTDINDSRGPFVDLTVTDPEYLECENFHELFLTKKEGDPDEWFQCFIDQAAYYADTGIWQKGWNPKWIATSDNFAEGILEKILNNRLLGRKKEGQRIGIANLQPDALGIQLPQERGEPGEPEDDGILRFKGKIFKPYSDAAFEALTDDEQVEYVEIENLWNQLN